jgi:hypothetical protein
MDIFGCARVSRILKNARKFGVPYGSRTRVAAVKEKRFTVIQGNFAAWIALYRIWKDSRKRILDS